MFVSPLRQKQKVSPIDNDRRLLNYLVLGAYAMMAQVLTSLYYRVTVDLPTSKLVNLAHFTAWRPYQYRVLVPAIVHLLGWILHATDDQYYPLYVFVEMAFAFGAFIAFRAYLRAFVPDPNATFLSFFVIVPMLMMHVSCAMCHFPGDTPQIMLFTLGLLALRKQHWPWLYAILLIATFNRESSALLVVGFALTMLGKIPMRRYILHLAGLTLVFAVVKVFVNHLFVHNGGSFTEDHTGYSSYLLHQLLHGQPNVLGTVIFISLIPVLIIAGRRYIDGFLMRLLALGPCFLVIMYYVGVLDEVRAYNEMVPVLLTPLLVLLSGLAARVARGDGTAANETAEAAVAKATLASLRTA